MRKQGDVATRQGIKRHLAANKWPVAREVAKTGCRCKPVFPSAFSAGKLLSHAMLPAGTKMQPVAPLWNKDSPVKIAGSAHDSKHEQTVRNFDFPGRLMATLTVSSQLGHLTLVRLTPSSSFLHALRACVACRQEIYLRRLARCFKVQSDSESLGNA